MRKTTVYAALLAIVLMLAPVKNVFSQVSLKDENGKDVTLYNKSFALVIGVVNYTAGWPSLRGVQKDVEGVKQALEKQGFFVTVVLDPDSKSLDLAYKDFISKYGLDADNRLLFYFAGHGHTIHTAYGEEMGYIVPTDAPNPNTDKNNFLSKAMAMQQIEVYAKQIQSKHVLFLFDACFSGSIFAITRAIPENISYKTSKPVRQFISSGSADETVPDESIFRQQFMSGLDGEADLNNDGFITGTELGEFLTEKVINYSKNNQHPQYGKIRNPFLDKGDFVFLSKAEKEPNNSSNESSANLSRGANSKADNAYEADKSNSLKFVDDEVKKEKLPWDDEYQDMKSIFAKVAIRAMKGQYLFAENSPNGNVLAKADDFTTNEVFDVIPVGERKVALRSPKGKYLNATEDEKEVYADRDSIGKNETFEIVELEGDKVGFKTAHGKFLCAEWGGDNLVAANRTKIDVWEVFSFIKLRQVALKTFNGQVLNIDSDKELKAKGRLMQKKQEDNIYIEFVKLNRNKVALKSQTGFYLGVNGDKIYAEYTNPGNKSTFELVELEKNKIALKAQNGKYLTAVGGGGFGLKADGDEIGDWQKFEIVHLTPKAK
ncbi:MAG: caspase family protein [Bacteroidota bacterium]